MRSVDFSTISDLKIGLFAPQKILFQTDTMDKKQYKERVETVEKRNPHEPLLAVLKNGYSAVNVVYLGIAYSRLPTIEKQAKTPETPDTLEPVAVGTTVRINDAPVDADDAIMIDLANRLRVTQAQFYTKRKSFFDVPLDNAAASVAHRRSVAVALGILQKKISLIRRAVKRYKETGSLPQDFLDDTAVGNEETAALNEALSDDLFELYKKKQSISSQISRFIRELREAIPLGKDAAYIKERETKRLRLEAIKRKIDEKIIYLQKNSSVKT